jgi:hypothetical protein
MKLTKKGAIVTYTIIGIILVIIAAGVLFLVYGQLPKNYDKEACHNSVIARTSAILRGEGFLPEVYPLNCKTEDITIKDSNPDLIKRTVANSMYDCWWMMGEGKLRPFSESGWRQAGMFGTSRAKCVICSVIKFDDSLKQTPEKFDLMRYLSDTKMPLKNITYLEYFADNPGARTDNLVNVEQSTTKDDLAVIYMQIMGDDLGSMLKREGGTMLALVTGGLGASKALTGSFGTIGKLFIGGSGAAAPAGMTSLAADASALGIAPAQAELLGLGGGSVATTAGSTAMSGVAKAGIWGAVAVFAAITAGQITTFWTSTHAAAVHCDGNRNGCDAVIVAPYNAAGLTQACQDIESIP